MYSSLVPRFMFPGCERLTGHRFWTEVARLRFRQWTSPSELEARVAQRVQAPCRCGRGWPSIAAIEAARARP